MHLAVDFVEVFSRHLGCRAALNCLLSQRFQLCFGFFHTEEVENRFIDEFGRVFIFAPLDTFFNELFGFRL